MNSRSSMQRQLLDTSALIQYWRQRQARFQGAITSFLARTWARELIAFYATNVIATPVYLEMVAGTTNRRELPATLAFLDEFRCVDEGKIPEQDWHEAVRLAQRVPSDRRPRQLADCLIRAIAHRLKYQVKTLDKHFPR